MKLRVYINIPKKSEINLEDAAQTLKSSQLGVLEICPLTVETAKKTGSKLSLLMSVPKDAGLIFKKGEVLNYAKIELKEYFLDKFAETTGKIDVKMLKS